MFLTPLQAVVCGRERGDVMTGEQYSNTRHVFSVTGNRALGNIEFHHHDIDLTANVGREVDEQGLKLHSIIISTTSLPHPVMIQLS
jgi:hypothetical protein